MRKPVILRLDGVELPALERRVLGMLDCALDRPLAVRIADPACIGDDAIMGEQGRVDSVDLGLVEIGPDHTRLQVIEDGISHRSTEGPEGFLVQPGPGLLIGFPDDFPKRLARVLQRHHEQERAAVFAVRPTDRRAETEVHLCLLAGQALEHIEALGVPNLQAANETLDRVVALFEAEQLNEILIDRLSVAAQPDLLLNPGAVRLASGACVLRQSRWPGWGILAATSPGAGGHGGL